MGFMGIEDFEALVVEGVDAIPERAEALKVAVAESARKVAIQF